MQLKPQLKIIRVKMKHFRQFLTEEISIETQKITELLVDNVYSEYVKKYNKNSVECVGWLDGTHNAAVRSVSYTHLRAHET